MPYRSRSRVPQYPARLKRKTFWVASGDITGGTALAAGAAILDQSITWSDELGPATIVRTRGTLWVSVDQIAATEEPFGAIGFSVVKNAAAVAGVASVPTPITEESDDSFFLWQAFCASIRLSSAVGITFPSFERYDLDSKAQRKIQQGDTIVATLENANATAGLIYILKFRMLIKTN